MKTKFVFLLLPHIHLMDLAGPDQAIHEAIDFGADFEIEYCQAVAHVVSTAGLPIGELKHYSDVNFDPGDFLIIPGSKVDYILSAEFRKSLLLFEWIRQAYNSGVRLCSICSGSFVLAECGLLDQLPCTTHFKRTSQLQLLYPKLKVVENILFTDQDGIYTSAGIASGIDLMLHIIAQLKGNHFSHQVAREMVVYNRRSGSTSQDSELLKFRNHIHSVIHIAQDWITDNIHLKASLGELAEIAGMSERNFTRIFKKETKITVNDYIRLIRTERSSQLLKNTNLSRAEIAHKVGLKSDRQLSRIINTWKQDL